MVNFNNFFLGLVAAASSVSAIDVYFHVGWDCSGAATVCYGLNPGVCCTGNSQAVAYRGVPTNWNIDATGYSGGGCSAFNNIKYFRGDHWACMGVVTRYTYTGSRYQFVNLRRGEEIQEQTNCTESVKPDTLLLADGVTKYDLTQLDDAKVAELVAIADKGVGPEEIPAEFHALRK
ncbi:hypothetical protein QBC38DRAFT_540305 [Podospora fimiseda]|uniref:Secreted protein n=1 Tax=Podospora fimiseda TaxID=252190 RepID=A0AAN6YM41_9PEZI|nr:hypothetical protein QBC38DRAFT_540305 [Podospora fimiseda]